MLRVQIIDMHRLLWVYTSDDQKHNISDALLEEYIVNDGTLDQCRELIWEGDGKRVAEGFIVATVSCQGTTINPTHRPIELRSYQADGGESYLLRTATKASTATLRHVQVFISDGRLVLEHHYPIGTAYAHLDLSLLRQGTYHLLINGTEHHVVVRE